MMKVRIRRASKDIELPKREPDSAAAFDFAASETVTVQPKHMARIKTGLYIDVPQGYFLAILPRSSTFGRTGLIFPHSIGVIDPLYSGPEDEILIQVYNPTDKPAVIEKGDRMAQGMILESPRVEWEEVDMLKTESRGGFGSTNKE